MTVAAQQQFSRAQDELDEAARTERADRGGTEAYLHAHMAALRAAAALTVGQVATTGGRRRVRSVWEQLAELGESWSPWAEAFAAGAAVRAAIESGQLQSLGHEQIESAIARATQFVELTGRELEERERALRGAVFDGGPWGRPMHPMARAS